MATRKGINISGNSAAPHILHALFIYVLCLKKIERSEKIVFYILLKTQRPSDTVFKFRVNKSNSSQRLYVRIEFLKFKSKTKPF